MTIEQMRIGELAGDVLAVLNKQAEYFKSRDRDVLIVSKRMEKALREKCERAIAEAKGQA